MTGHLSDEQFSELLYGDSPLDASRHLLVCSQCQSEFKRVRSSLDDFASMGLAWAEKRASTSIPIPSLLVRNWYSMSTGAAAAVVLAAAIVFGVHQEKPVDTPQTSVAAEQQTDFASEVAADDRLMIAIDKEIRWQTESAVSIEHLAAPARATHSHSSHRLTN
jgi:hypothetical protein